MTHPDHLTSEDAVSLASILERSPGLAGTAAHVRGFATMMTERQGQRLDQWIADVRADTLPALHSFANGLQRDHNAVQARAHPALLIWCGREHRLQTQVSEEENVRMCEL